MNYDLQMKNERCINLKHMYLIRLVTFMPKTNGLELIYKSELNTSRTLNTSALLFTFCFQKPETRYVLIRITFQNKKLSNLF